MRRTRVVMQPKHPLGLSQILRSSADTVRERISSVGLARFEMIPVFIYYAIALINSRPTVFYVFVTVD